MSSLCGVRGLVVPSIATLVTLSALANAAALPVRATTTRVIVLIPDPPIAEVDVERLRQALHLYAGALDPMFVPAPAVVAPDPDVRAAALRLCTALEGRAVAWFYRSDERVVVTLAAQSREPSDDATFFVPLAPAAPSNVYRGIARKRASSVWSLTSEARATTAVVATAGADLPAATVPPIWTPQIRIGVQGGAWGRSRTWWSEVTLAAGVSWQRVHVGAAIGWGPAARTRVAAGTLSLQVGETLAWCDVDMPPLAPLDLSFSAQLGAIIVHAEAERALTGARAIQWAAIPTLRLGPRAAWGGRGAGGIEAMAGVDLRAQVTRFVL
ncbi:MAG: hypothetical protein AAB426_02370, partial [Myxococcota bacterium]